MKITHIETMHVRPRWLLLKVHTDKGIIGLGDATLEGRAQTVATCVHEFERMLGGQDPRRIEHLWQMMYRQTFYRGGPIMCSAISGIEQALWDILGKSLGVPVHQLLGGRVRDRIRMYGWTRGAKTGGYIEDFKHHLEARQFTAYKFAPIKDCRLIESPAAMQQAVKLVAEARQIVGDQIDLAVDFHGRSAPALSRRLAQKLEPFDLLFIEEPVLPGDITGLKAIAAATSTPIATGERLFTRWQFQEVIEAGAVAVVQPDISHVGGIFEGRKIAAMAESRNMAVAPHCPLSAVSLAACLQLDACTPNFLIQEHVTLGADYLKQPFVVKDGYIDVPTGPGLGIELDDAKVAAGLFDGDWDTPTFALEDGGVAEW